MCERNVACSSVTFVICARLNSWKPPLSVRIGRPTARTYAGRERPDVSSPCPQGEMIVFPESFGRRCRAVGRR